jgi:septal ring factor EnvC (AmiA/AmiB activator)
MNEIQTTVIDKLTVEILILKQQTAQNIIEIGKRLIEVKESLPHGGWGNWLKEKVDFTDRTAQRFMKVASEFSNTTTLSDLPRSKAFALLELPQEERETFVKENPVNEMTTRELQQAIKDRDKAENEKNTAEDNLKIYQSQLNQAIIDAKQLEEDKVKSELKLKALESELKSEKDNLKKEKENQKEEILKLQTFIGEAKISGNDEEVERLQASLLEAQNDLDSSALKIDELEEQLKKPVDVITAEPVIIEKVPDEIEKELQELRAKTNQNTSQPVLKFKIYFEELQNIFRNELETMDEIKKDYPEMYEKCKGAITNLINKMSERL